MSARTRPMIVCAECPFRRDDDERAKLMAQVDAGAWVACVHTIAPASVPRGSIHGRVRAMEQEVECDGARMWRRDRQLP